MFSMLDVYLTSNILLWLLNVEDIKFGGERMTVVTDRKQLNKLYLLKQRRHHY